ncbi:SIR2 family protein [Vibrio cholerae]|uniref:SIR2 family protein n=1 Tax=Vibrio cholerae TaxID=666 RepID=UPI0022F2A580|nr:SIR2 family protein [Vibrio cholerae]MDA5316976.1 SIR2 family protein [Vibrio cholerae]
MNVSDFVNRFTNHPVLFIGTGFSLRYLTNSYSWDSLLAHIAFELTGNDEFYLDIKARSLLKNGSFDYEQVADELEQIFNVQLANDRNGKFADINATFYEHMRNGKCLSRFKIYISKLVGDLRFKDNIDAEIAALKKARKNIGSIITTNYDELVENIFGFNKLVGNDILLSNPYGSVYKIHGCVTDPDRIIITKKDYSVFDERYELIRAQLLSLFIHNPIIFIGYSVSDVNIKSILNTIFSYVEPNSEQANKIRSNFLLVEYDEGNLSVDIVEHDIDINGNQIRINKVKTNNFQSVYEALSELVLPVSAMDVRKVQSVWRTIITGGDIKVKITEDLDKLSNGEMVIAVGSEKTITYDFMTTKEMIRNYFQIIEESNSQLLKTLNKQKVQVNQWFPCFAFGSICKELTSIERMKENQTSKLNISLNNDEFNHTHHTVDGIMSDASIRASSKHKAIAWYTYKGLLDLEDVKNFLIDFKDDKSTTYNMMICAYDYKAYGAQ